MVLTLEIKNRISGMPCKNRRAGRERSFPVCFLCYCPWGFASENSFLNAAACVETELSPLEVLQETQMIEKELGRTKKSVNGIYSDRLIDIDLLLYEDLVLSVTSASGAELTLPHPLMAERDFVMKPLAEIAPDILHPVLGKTMKGILNAL